MRKMMIVGLVMAGLVSASGQAQSAAKKPEPPPQGLPATAVKAGEGVWKWKDPQGKSWIYHRTAFGYTRAEDVPEKSVAAQLGLRVVEVKADQVTFEQATPFGKSRWVRARADMSAAEKAAYEAHEKSAQSAK
jgi:hypothetical protein